MLDEIKAGRNLNKIDLPEDTNRGGLLAQIREGKDLKKVDLDEMKKPIQHSTTLDTIAEAVYQRGSQMKRESRDEERERKVSDISWKDDSDSAFSDDEEDKPVKQRSSVKESKKHARASSGDFPRLTHSIKEEEEEKPIPAWKVAVLEKRKSHGVETEMRGDEEEEEKTPVIMGADGTPLPQWRAAMIAKKQEQEEAEENEKQKKLSLQEAKFEGVPLWKRKLMEKRAQEKETEEAKKREKQQELQDKLDTIAAMPAWKRELFFEKNPQYRDMLKTL